MKKVCICGHFGFGKDLLNGQTVKTKMLAEELVRIFGPDEVELMDTHGGWKFLLKVPFESFRALRNCKNFVILPAQKGLRVIAPLLAVYNYFLKRELHYVVIGGWLPSFLRRRKGLSNTLKKFSGVYVETNTMRDLLERQDFFNIVVMTNFKRLDILDEILEADCPDRPYKLCTFSRVRKEKGIGDAVSAVTQINEKRNSIVYTLDIYGPVDSDQMVWFEELKQRFSASVSYKGAVPYNRSVEILKEYDALLFPTRYYTEGIPGTIIDAYAAGVPVIATMWESFADVVDHYGTGIGVPWEGSLQEVLDELLDSPEVLSKMKGSCLVKAKQFKPEAAMAPFLHRLK